MNGICVPERRALVGTLLVVQWLGVSAPSAGGLGSIPGQETRSHVTQLKSHKLQQRLKIDRAATRGQCSQVNR